MCIRTTGYTGIIHSSGNGKGHTEVYPDSLSETHLSAAQKRLQEAVL